MELGLDLRFVWTIVWERYNNLRTKYDSQLVDLQLITGAGMSIERGINPLTPGGVVYLSDGEGSSCLYSY